MHKKQQKKKQSGFTLIEILVVIGIIAILAAVVLIAINPARQFASANDSQRTSNVNAILNAIGQYAADNKGDLPAGLDNGTCPSATPCALANTDLDICTALVPTYIPALPVDPDNGEPVAACGGAYDTGYTASVDTNGRVTIDAPGAQLAAVITVTR